MATVLESDVIAGVMLVEPVVHGDARGLFVETFRREWIPQAREMIQMNRADRQAGCIVGLHDHGGIYIPPGVAHGFSSLTDMTITYLVDGYYDPNDELGMAWDDPELGDVWGLTDPPILSGRDSENPRRSEIADDMHPGFVPVTS